MRLTESELPVCLTLREEVNSEGRPLSSPLQCQQRKTTGNGEGKGKGGGERVWSENDMTGPEHT